MAVDFEKDLLLITAASGKQASGLLPHLAKQWKRLRLQCMSDSSCKRLQQQYPHAEVVQGSFLDMADAKKLMEGVSACFLITPAFHPRESQYGISIIDAAAENLRVGGLFKHMVFSSVLDSCIRAMSNHDNKRFVEEALVESDVPYTIIQPTHLMDNVPIRQIANQADPVFPAHFDPSTKMSFVCIDDLGEAVSKIFAHRQDHLYAIYPFVGTPVPLSYHDAMDIASSVIGKSVRVEALALEKVVDGYAARAISGDVTEGEAKAMRRNFARMIVYYNSKGLVGNSKVLEMVLGRKPLGYREWVELQLKS